MEKWQVEHITKSLPELIQVTDCNIFLISLLDASDMLSKDDVDQLLGKQNDIARSIQLYQILQTRHNGYEQLIRALKETNQTQALNTVNATKATSDQPSAGYSEDFMKFHLQRSDIQRAYKPIYIGDFVSSGTFNSKIYKGIYEEQEVFVKIIICPNIDNATLMNEIEKVKSVGNHDNLISYYYGDYINNQLQLVMGICETNLFECITQKTIPFSAPQICKQITMGLNFLHEKNNLVHGNLKPQNILICYNPCKVKLSDFGMWTIHSELVKCFVKSDVYIGILDWMAPELIEEYEVTDQFPKPTYRSDMFSLGCIFYFIISVGSHPFGSEIKRASNILEGRVELSSSSILKFDVPALALTSLLIFKTSIYRPLTSAVLLSTYFMNMDENSLGELPLQTKPKPATSPNYVSVEDMQNHIIKNMNSLISSTETNYTLLSSLVALGILSRYDVEILESIPVRGHRNRQLYMMIHDKLPGQPDMYHKLITTLCENTLLQSGASSVLRSLYQKR